MEPKCATNGAGSNTSQMTVGDFIRPMAEIQDTQTDLCSTRHTSASILVRLGFENESATKEINSWLSCSYSTTLQRLHRLNDWGVLRSSGKGGGYNWTLQTENVEARTEAECVDINEVILLITEVVSELAEQLETQRERGSLPEAVVDWIEARSLPSDTDRQEYAFRVAIYRRYLQSLLYRLHRPEYENTLPELKAESNWQGQFSTAFEETGDSGFQATAIDDLIRPAPTWLDKVLLALHGPLYSVDTPATAFANIYESLVSQDARRDLGQFATPEYVGEFLASWAVQNADDCILDPGIGAGQLASQALDEKLKRGEEDPISDITGVDIDETAVAMSAVTLKLVDGAGSGDIHNKDFIEFSPRSFEEDGYSVTAVDGVIANPPYSRHQAVDDDKKARLNEIITKESDYDLSLRTPLYGYFLIHAAQFLESGGRLSAIVPSKFLDTEFGRDLKRFLKAEFDIRGIIQFENGFDIFDGVKTSPAILLLEKDESKIESPTQILSLSSWPTNTSAPTLLSATSEDLSEISQATAVSQELLSPTERWSHYHEDDDLLDEAEMAKFDDIADIGRGIATGDNDYFCLSQSEVEEYGIPREYRTPIIRSAHGLKKIDLTEKDWTEWLQDGKKVWLLYCYSDDEPIEKSAIEDEGVLDYLKQGEEGDTIDGYLVSGRDPWYRVEKQTPAPILAKYMNRTGFLFMRNHAGLRSLNNVHKISVEDEYTEKQYEALLAYLNSRVLEKYLTKHSMDYDGLKKIEVGQLEEAPVIDPKKIDDESLENLSQLYDDLRRVRRRDMDDEEVLDEIHQELEPVLNWADESQE